MGRYQSDVVCGINHSEFEDRMVLVDARLDADTLFDVLEDTAAKTDCIVIESEINDSQTGQVVLCFLDRYKMFLEYIYAEKIPETNIKNSSYPPPQKHNTNTEERWKISIKLTDTIGNSSEAGYVTLANSYTENYYLNDCGGYDDFRKSHGTEITARLKNIYSLVDPTKGEKILDVGCGRGELAFALAAAGAEVEAIDYSKDAIAIAIRTFDGKYNNLHYTYADIMKMDDLDSFDKIVMADVVEHIEQEVLEKIFEKISASLNKNGIVIIHTAPNKDYYERIYPKVREQAAKFGCWKPREPRSYYEQLMHINEQTPAGLEKALRKYFRHVHIWSGGFREMDRQKTSEESCRDVEIFAIAAQESNPIERRISKFVKSPEWAECQVEIESGDIVVPKGENSCFVPIRVRNFGSEVISSQRKHPINLAYHILDREGNMIIFDGERTSIYDEIQPGTQKEMKLKFMRPSGLTLNEEYICRITLVAEGYFWFDQEGGNKKDVFLRVQ